MLIAFIGGPYIPFIWYHSLMALMPICFIIFFSAFALESPYYNPQGVSSRTEELLKKLRGVDNVTDEVNQIKRCLEETCEENFFEQIKLKGPKKHFC
ncbi:hypothetical protein WA026_005976 [Henosepilachna vigintioctopunctata]|uniref:Uncharacterized protein n=1 Tax=Henosepilachna vigintioctopunctata TaxID=420089 RepID=A0AAW1TY29_9CUCU